MKKLKLKSIYDLQESLNTTFKTMAISDTADIIGIDYRELNLLLRKKAKKNVNIEKIISKIKSISKDEEFNKKVIYKLTLINDYGTIDFKSDNRISGYIRTKNNTYLLECDINYNKDKESNRKYAGVYEINDDNSYQIKYDETNTKIFKLDNENKSINIKNNKEIYYFDSEGIEYQNEKEENLENYFLDKDGNKKYHDPSPFENYTKRKSTKKLNNETLIFRRKVEYKVKDNGTFTKDSDNIFIGDNVSPNSKRIPEAGNFEYLEEDLYKGFLEGQYKIEDLYKYRGDRFNKSKCIKKNINNI